ncbi:MAG: methionyl-tRNA formyltransferase [Deltaproteobacteria bacterium]|nr:methionyl-tRNA formyltransferase [Deltaproteobacteria bacterium]
MATIVFFGTPAFSVSSLTALIDNGYKVAAVVTQPDKPAGRGSALTSPPVKVAAINHSIPVLQPHSIKKEISAFTGELAQFGPFDLGVVVAFGQILPRTILEIPRLGCINIHASLLPRWRGAAPIQRSILCGDSETGVCIMQMDEGLDTGPVFSCEKIPISDSDDAGALHDKLAQAGAALLVNTIPSILEGSKQAQPQSEEGVTYAGKILPAEGRIDWTESGEKITRQLRAFSPYPGAYSSVNGKRLKIFKAQWKPDTNVVARRQAGEIAYVDGEHLEVRCADGVLAIQDVQLEGKRRMPAPEFLRGCRLRLGDKFE